MKIGIDLGTTNSVVAIVETKGTRILDNKEGEQMTPSVVAGKKGEIIVGSVGRKRLVMDPLNTIYSVKRLMGRGFKDDEVKKMISDVPYKIIRPQNGTEESLSIMLNGREYTPIEISSAILKKIKDDVEFRVGEEVKDAVITVPAYFSEIQKRATMEAGKMAGLNVMRIIDEPTAAAISYGIVEEAETDEPKMALVFDLGGGTFDISVIALSGGSTVQLNLEGDMWLGGDNFDQVIIDHLIEKIKEEENVDVRNDSKMMAVIKREAQNAKETLSHSRSADIIIEGRDLDFEIEITREQFENWIEPLIVKCQNLVDKAILGAGFEGPQDIDIVIMAGNSTLIPAVQQSMEAKFGLEKVKRKLHPKLCVADGAAKAAAIWPEDSRQCIRCNTTNAVNEKKCTKCGFNFVEEESGQLAFSYGIEQIGDRFNIFYEKGTPYPIKPEDQVTKTVNTNFNNQRMILVAIYGGEHEKVSQNEKQGEVFAVLPHGLPNGAGVKIKLWINKDGLFELQTMLETGETLQCIILRGHSDSKAVNEAYKKLDDYSTKKAQIPHDEQLKIEKKLDEVLNRLINGEFDDAISECKEIKIEEIKSSSENGTPPAFDYQQALTIVNNIMAQYGDYLSPTQRYKLQDKKEELTNAINSGNTALGKKIANEVLKMIDDFMFEDINGQKMPSVFGIVIISQSSLMQAEQKDPAEVGRQRLKEKREEALIEIRMGNKTKGIMDLSMVMMKAQEIIGKGTSVPGMIKCPHCGKMTPRNKPTCNYCTKPIIIGGDQIGAESSSYLNSFTVGS